MKSEIRCSNIGLVGTKLKKSIWGVRVRVCRGFIKGQKPGKLTSCEDDFAHLV